jgi:hypothetical protein
LRLLHLKQQETAVVTAIDLQGGSGSAGLAGQNENNADAPPGDRDIDFVTFVLDRLGPEADAVKNIKDFVQMLLLLMLAKMLRTQVRQSRVQQLVRWFDMLAKTIDASGDGVSGHLQDVVLQIQTHLSGATQLNQDMGEGSQRETIIAAFQLLKQKADHMAASMIPVSGG